MKAQEVTFYVMCQHFKNLGIKLIFSGIYMCQHRCGVNSTKVEAWGKTNTPDFAVYKTRKMSMNLLGQKLDLIQLIYSLYSFIQRPEQESKPYIGHTD